MKRVNASDASLASVSLNTTMSSPPTTDWLPPGPAGTGAYANVELGELVREDARHPGAFEDRGCLAVAELVGRGRAAAEDAGRKVARVQPLLELGHRGDRALAVEVRPVAVVRSSVGDAAPEAPDPGQHAPGAGAALGVAVDVGPELLLDGGQRGLELLDGRGLLR